MKVTIPENINEITLSQYQRFDKANKGDDQEFILHRLLSIFCGITMKEAMNIKLEDAEEIARDVADVLETEGSFKKTFKHNDKEWGFIPNLNDITLGEFVDLDENLKDTQTLHKAMAVLYRPIKKRFKGLYSIERYEGSSKYSEELKTMPLGVATAAVVFFYRLGNELALHSSHYFQNVKEMTKTTLQKPSSEQNTAGLAAYISLVEEMLQNLRVSLTKSS